MNDELTRWLIRQIEALGFTKLFLCVLAAGVLVWGVGIALGWIFAQRSAIASIGKTKAETSAILHELFQKLEQLRSQVNLQSESLGLRLRDLIESLKSGSREAMHSQREELCRFYDADYSPALGKYLEQIPRLLDRKEAYNRLLEDVLPTMETMVKFLQTINHDRLLDGCRTKFF